MESTITSNGQTTLPKAVREHLRLKPGDRVKYFFHPDGSVVLLPKTPASALRGMLASRQKGLVALNEMEEAIASVRSDVPKA